jgi:hypothetical protein
VACFPVFPLTLLPPQFLARHKPASSLGWEDDASLGLWYQDKEVYPLEKLDDHCVEVKLLCVENFRPETVAELAGGGYAAKCESFAFYVRLELRHGERTICPPVISKRTAAPPVWCEWLRLSLPLSDLPLVRYSPPPRVGPVQAPGPPPKQRVCLAGVPVCAHPLCRQPAARRAARLRYVATRPRPFS